MIDSRYTFTVEVRRAGVLLGAAAAGVGTCAEDAHFRAVLRGTLANDGAAPPFTILPIWADSGPPGVRGLVVTAAGAPVARYELEVFAPRVRALLAELLNKQLIRSDETVDWSVSATETPPPAGRRVRARVLRTPYPFHDCALPAVEPETLAVVIDACVLDVIRARVTASPTVECAGLLAGRLLRDPSRAAAALRITAELPLPAGRRGASSVHFAFGPDSFRAARRQLASLADGGAAVGWWHNHCPCENCPSRPECTADTVFFSVDDVQVHTSLFPAAPYAVALVAGKVRDRPAHDPGFRLYGWEKALITERAVACEGGELRTPRRRIAAQAGAIV